MIRNPKRLFSLVLAVLAAILGGVVPARADDLGDFEAARAFYEAQDYGRAAAALHALVGTNPPHLSDYLLVIESRKYLAASYLFLGEAQNAAEQFRLLLEAEPDYVLDPLAFPTDVLAAFETVKAKLRAEQMARREAERRAREEALAAQARREAERRERLERLWRIAREEEVRTHNSRWIATVPFGVGQFQNGHGGLGAALAMAEGLTAGASVVSFILHERLRDEHPSPNEVADIRGQENLWRTVNVASFASFVGLAVIGIIDAHVRFVPDRVEKRPRTLPEGMDEWVEVQLAPPAPSSSASPVPR